MKTLAEFQEAYRLPLLELLYRAASVRRQHRDPADVQRCTLLSIKTGGCPEDCAYCPQSAHYDTGVGRHGLLSVEQVRAAAERAKAAGATRFCMGAAWRSVPEDGRFAVYVHIPFCIRRCLFCHYPSLYGAPDSEKDKYLDALEKEMDLGLRRLGIDKINVRSILIGGGTPTDLTPPQLKRFLDYFTARTDLSKCTQFNYDVDPATLVGPDGLERLRGVFVRIEQPVEFESVDDQPVDLLFALFAPKNAGADHLRALARVSRIMRQGELREQLRKARTADALHALLVQDAARPAA